MSTGDNPSESSAELVRALALLLNETNMTEIEYTRGDLHIRVARTVPAVMPAASVPPAPGFVDVAVPAAVPVREDNAFQNHPGLITSPMVGVVYTSPEPSAPNFAVIGETVKEGQTLLLIEAMKVFNPITAPRSGRLLRVFVSNGAPVEYGEPLLVIE
ncbi:MAG: acetyl-CoA carboxylase biotin carboxyl carrier protein [Rhodospirillales bacterium]|nr:acetyl-CoA carboxylase biotin carboxyl carrier protein [Rhodospirillales bacterium]